MSMSKPQVLWIWTVALFGRCAFVATKVRHVSLFLSFLTTWTTQKPAPSWKEQAMCWRSVIQWSLYRLAGTSWNSAEANAESHICHTPTQVRNWLGKRHLCRGEPGTCSGESTSHQCAAIAGKANRTMGCINESKSIRGNVYVPLLRPVRGHLTKYIQFGDRFSVQWRYWAKWPPRSPST